jgi:hypothetical protein
MIEFTMDGRWRWDFLVLVSGDDGMIGEWSIGWMGYTLVLVRHSSTMIFVMGMDTCIALDILC